MPSSPGLPPNNSSKPTLLRGAAQLRRSDVRFWPKAVIGGKRVGRSYGIEVRELSAPKGVHLLAMNDWSIHIEIETRKRKCNDEWSEKTPASLTPAVIPNNWSPKSLRWGSEPEEHCK